MKGKNNGEHLPLYGVGPLYVIAIAGLTLAAVLCGRTAVFAGGRLGALRTPLAILGGLMILAGAAMWVLAVLGAKVDDGIRENRLVTGGIYAWVRNPIYSAFMIACTGVLLIAGNAYFFGLPLLYWLFMTVLMKETEEKWLWEKFGAEYGGYCRHVNRCWPWFPRRR